MNNTDLAAINARAKVIAQKISKAVGIRHRNADPVFRARMGYLSASQVQDILADLRTGEFTQLEVAERWLISGARVNQIAKAHGIPAAFKGRPKGTFGRHYVRSSHHAR